MEDTVEKKKKGRPKKNTNENIDKIPTIENVENSVLNDAEKKKRGRKKKKVDEVKIKKKRGRKAALKYFSSSIRKQISLKTNIVDNENNILFLDIQEDNIIEENQSETNTFINLKDINDNDINPPLNGDNDNITDIINAVDTMHLNDNVMNLNNNMYIYENTNSNDDFIIKTPKKTLSFSNMTMTEDYNTFNTMNTSINLSENKIKNDLLENDIIVQKDNIKKGYFQMFNYFDNWMEKTDIKCWWCCHNFNTLPLGCPTKYESKINKFRVKGIFCSFACMLAYAKNTKGFEYKQYLIKFLYKKLTGCQYDNILYKEAPSRYTLKEFGGHLSIDEFRKLSNEHTFYKMIEYPMYESRDYIAEVDLLNIKQVNDKIFKNEKTKIILDDKKIQEVKQRISKIDQNVTISNSIENFIKN